MVRREFWPPALLWLPGGLVARAAARFGVSAGAFADPAELPAALGSLAVAAPRGLPLAPCCCRFWRLGYRRAAWAAGIGVGVMTVPATVFVGLLGPVAVAVCAVPLSLPAWIAWRWLARYG